MHKTRYMKITQVGQEVLYKGYEAVVIAIAEGDIFAYKKSKIRYTKKSFWTRKEKVVEIWTSNVYLDIITR